MRSRTASLLVAAATVAASCGWLQPPAQSRFVVSNQDAPVRVEVPNGPTLVAAPKAFEAGTEIAIGPGADRPPAELGAGRLSAAWAVSSTSAPRAAVELVLPLPPSWSTSLLAHWNSAGDWEALAFERTSDGRARVLVDRFSSFGFIDFGTVEQAAAALFSRAKRTLVDLLSAGTTCPPNSSGWTAIAEGAGAERLAVAATDVGTNTLRLHLCNNRHVFLDAVITPSAASGPVLVSPRRTAEVLIGRPGGDAVRAEFGVTARAVAYTWLLIGATALPGGATAAAYLGELAPAALGELIGCASQKVAVRSLRGSQELSLGMLACLGEPRVADELATAVASALHQRGQLRAAESASDYVRFGGAALRALATTRQIVELAQIAFESNLLFAQMLAGQVAGTGLATFSLRGPAALVATPSPTPSPTVTPKLDPLVVTSSRPTPTSAPTVRTTPTTYAIRGRVTASDTGAGVGGVRVGAGSTAGGGETLTDGTGNYLLRLPQGTYVLNFGLTFAGGGYADRFWCPGNVVCQPVNSSPGPNFVVSGDMSNVSLTVTLCSQLTNANRFVVSGTVRNSAGVSMARARVLAYVPGQESAGVSACTDASGAFALRLNPGSYVIVVTPAPAAPWYYSQVWKDLNYVSPGEGVAPLDRATRVTVTGDVSGINPVLVPYACSSSRTKTFCNP